jgi:cob(I)alamin adenosyltransferase
MTIYTRDGDDGETSLYGGGRIGKDALRIEVCGAIDELNSLLGLVRTEPLSREIDGVFARIQHELFDVGAEVASVDPTRRKTAAVNAGHIQALEADIDRLDATLEPLRTLILPGGCRAAALAHCARAVCRRAERRLVALARAEGETISPALLAYMNRLGDLLFVLARATNRDAGTSEAAWKKPS